MKSVQLFIAMFALVGSASFAASSDTKEYSIKHYCKTGEVAVAETKVSSKGDGTFSVRVKCSPADCFVSLPHSSGRTVNLIASRTSFFNLRPDAEISSMQTIAQIASKDKSQARTEVQKLVDQGVCKQAIFDSVLNHF